MKSIVLFKARVPKEVVSLDEVEHGKPVVIHAFHGSMHPETIQREGFRVPEHERNPLNPGIQARLHREGFLGRGVYFTDSKHTASHYGSPLRVSVRLKNPYVIPHGSMEDFKRMDPEQLRAKGHDGIIVRHGRYGLRGETYRQGVAFDPASVTIHEGAFRTSSLQAGSRVRHRVTGESGVVNTGLRSLKGVKKFHPRGANYIFGVRWNGSQRYGTKARTDLNVYDHQVELRKAIVPDPVGQRTFQGLVIMIENPKGSVRKDLKHRPPRWTTKMKCDYGYIIGTQNTGLDERLSKALPKRLRHLVLPYSGPVDVHQHSSIDMAERKVPFVKNDGEVHRLTLAEDGKVYHWGGEVSENGAAMHYEVERRLGVRAKARATVYGQDYEVRGIDDRGIESPAALVDDRFRRLAASMIVPRMEDYGGKSLGPPGHGFWKAVAFSQHLRNVADSYVHSAGLSPIQHTPRHHFRVDEGLAKELADHFDTARHEPARPEVQSSYHHLTQETLSQFHHLKANGYHFSVWNKPGQPYKNSEEMAQDVNENKHLHVFPTFPTGHNEGGFGAGEATSRHHPMLADSGVRDGGHRWLHNDIFRAVHDVFGHAKEGNQFGPRGEENAWRSHAQMYSHRARMALTGETRAQNSWVNFGQHLRTAGNGGIPKAGEVGYVHPTNRPYAEQKATRIPLHFTDPHRVTPDQAPVEKSYREDDEREYVNHNWRHHRSFKKRRHSGAHKTGVRKSFNNALDCFIGPVDDAPYAYVVKQVNPKTGAFDEVKVMLGFASADAAKVMYLKHYDSPKFFGGISAIPMLKFRSLVTMRKALPSEYRGQHGAPDRSGAPIHDLTQNAVYPKDVYQMPHWYYNQRDQHESEGMWTAIGQRGRITVTKHTGQVRPARLWVYRAVPNERGMLHIHPGDWVTTVRGYAREHARTGNMRVLAARVNTDDIHTNGDSIVEWGYNGDRPVKGIVVHRPRGAHK